MCLFYLFWSLFIRHAFYCRFAELVIFISGKNFLIYTKCLSTARKLVPALLILCSAFYISNMCVCVCVFTNLACNMDYPWFSVSNLLFWWLKWASCKQIISQFVYLLLCPLSRLFLNFLKCPRIDLHAQSIQDHLEELYHAMILNLCRGVNNWRPATVQTCIFLYILQIPFPLPWFFAGFISHPISQSPRLGLKVGSLNCILIIIWTTLVSFCIAASFWL